MDIRGVSNYVAPAATSDVKPQAAPQEKPQAQQGDSVQIGGDQLTMPEAIKPKKKWLFVNYVAADCNLKEFQMKNLDNQELVGSDANTHVVAYIDVGPQPAPLGGGWKDCRTYYINKDDTPDKLNSEVIAEHGKTDMSNPQTLTKFLVDAVGKFPADHVCLVMNDHGGGFTGAMADDSDGNLMSVPQINQALADAEKITGKKIDIIGFDACLMAEGEVAYELKDRGKILLASEESEGGPGWTYNSMLGGETMAKAIKTVQESMIHKINVGPEEFAKIVVNVNKQHSEDIPTFSAIDLGKMNEFKDTMNSFAKAVRKSDDKETVRQAITSAENYGGGWAPYKDIRDAGHVADNIIAKTKDPDLKKAAENIKETLKGVVMANEVNEQQHPKSQGISIFAPTQKSSMEASYGDLQWVKDTEWDEMLNDIGLSGGSSDQNKAEGPMTSRWWPDGSPKKLP